MVQVVQLNSSTCKAVHFNAPFNWLYRNSTIDSIEFNHFQEDSIPKTYFQIAALACGWCPATTVFGMVSLALIILQSKQQNIWIW